MAEPQTMGGKQMSRLSEHQVTFFLFEYFDDHVLYASDDSFLDARLLRTLKSVSEEGVLLKVLLREEKKKTIQVLSSFEDAEPDTPCVRLLDYIEAILGGQVGRPALHVSVFIRG